jgi:hypothetical protein
MFYYLDELSFLTVFALPKASKIGLQLKILSSIGTSDNIILYIINILNIHYDFISSLII